MNMQTPGLPGQTPESWAPMPPTPPVAPAAPAAPEVTAWAPPAAPTHEAVQRAVTTANAAQNLVEAGPAKWEELTSTPSPESVAPMEIGHEMGASLAAQAEAHLRSTGAIKNADRLRELYSKPNRTETESAEMGRLEHIGLELLQAQVNKRMLDIENGPATR